MASASASLVQRTPAWHAARKGKLTASNVGAALGLCPWTSRQQAYNRAMGLERFLGELFNEIVGHVPASRLTLRPLLYTGNDATRWGTANEPNGILGYTASTGNIVDATGLHVHKSTSWLAGSPDGLIGTVGMLEVKCPYWRKKDGSRIHKAVPAHYYMQINLCLEICQREWCDFISWTPEGHAIYRITADHVLHEQMVPHYVKFFGAMQRMAKTPNTLSEDEKNAISSAVAKSMEEHIDYKYWVNIDPVDTPPSNDEDDEPAPKRVRINEAKIFELGSEKHVTDQA